MRFYLRRLSNKLYTLYKGDSARYDLFPISFLISFILLPPIGFLRSDVFAFGLFSSSYVSFLSLLGQEYPVYSIILVTLEDITSFIFNQFPGLF